jgi:hypothetical protein
VTILTIRATTAIRPSLFYLTIGSAATPADQANNMHILRFTNDGSGTAFTPTALDEGDPAATGVAVIDHSIEPTYTASSQLLSFSWNTRANFQFFSNPGAELIAPATADNGLGLRFVVSTGTQLTQATIHYSE